MEDCIPKYGIGTRHVDTRSELNLLKRWGIWCPLFSIFICRISTTQQAFHNHEASFISLILKGSYIQHEVDEEGNQSKKLVRWFNYVPHYIWHSIETINPVWSFHVMGPNKKSMIMLNIQGKIIRSTRMVKVNR